MKITSAILAIPGALLFAAPGMAQTSSANPTTAQKEHASKAADTLHGHVEQAEDIVNSLLRNRQAGSTAPQKNTLIAVHRSDLMKLQGELQAMSTDTPASQARSTAVKGTLSDHVREAKRLVDVISHDSVANQQTPPVGTSGSAQPSTASGSEPAASSSQPSAPSVAAQHDAGQNDIVTIDRTRVQELKKQIEAIERLEPKSK